MKTNSTQEKTNGDRCEKKTKRERKVVEIENESEIVSTILSDRNSVDTAVSSKYEWYIQDGVEDYNIDSWNRLAKILQIRREEKGF